MAQEPVAGARPEEMGRFSAIYWAANPLVEVWLRAFIGMRSPVTEWLY